MLRAPLRTLLRLQIRIQLRTRPRFRSRSTGAASALPILLFALLTLGCGSGEDGSMEDGSGEGVPGEAISRESFVATYVDLRLAALDDTTGVLASAERERILDSHGVTPEGLRRFVEVHGEDPRFMQQVWIEVEGRMRE